MKTLLFGLSLALATAPVFANSMHHARTPMERSGITSGYKAYAATPGYTSSPDVIFDNKVVGRDPDPNVRLQLYRDPGLLAN